MLPVILKLLIRKCFVQNRFYKLPVGQASSFDSLKKSALRIKIKDKKIEKLYLRLISFRKTHIGKVTLFPPGLKTLKFYCQSKEKLPGAHGRQSIRGMNSRVLSRILAEKEKEKVTNELQV